MTDVEHIECTIETNRAYHADTAYIGHSMAEVARKSLPRYGAMYVTKTLPVDPPTPDMVLGSLLHTFTLTPAAFDTDFLVADGCKARRGNAWEGYKQGAEATDRTPVLPDPVILARALREAVMAHDLACSLLEADGPVEQAIRWTDPVTGLKRKAKPDKLVIDDDFSAPLCCDLKSAADARPLPFLKAAYGFGYHRQADGYVDGCREEYRGALGGVWQFLFIAAGKEEPHDVYVHRCGMRFMMLGADSNSITLARLRDCYESGDWRAPEQKRLQTLEPLPWMKAEE